MAEAGRPRIYNADDVCKALDVYIDSNEEPLIQEFCLQYDISKDQLYVISQRDEEDSKRLADSMKKAIAKQEVFLVKNATRRTIDPVFSMFRLKQPCHGYTDRHEVTIDSKVVIFDGEPGE